MPEDIEIHAAAEANADFYRAFARGDVESMNALWATTSPLLCIHPGTPALHGREAVMESWRVVLAAPPPIRQSSAQVTIVRGVAFVTCLEHIGVATLAATNVFVWEEDKWRLVHHQAGLIDPLDPEADAPDGHLH
jgi:ketosteroid isomerase-like protein